jgi:hypothetical protein
VRNANNINDVNNIDNKNMHEAQAANAASTMVLVGNSRLWSRQLYACVANVLLMCC